MTSITIYKRLKDVGIDWNPVTVRVTEAQAIIFNDRLPGITCAEMCPLSRFIDDMYKNHVTNDEMEEIHWWKDAKNLVEQIKKQTQLKTHSKEGEEIEWSVKTF